MANRVVDVSWRPAGGSTTAARVLLIEHSATRAHLLREALRTLQQGWLHDSLVAYSVAEEIHVC